MSTDFTVIDNPDVKAFIEIFLNADEETREVAWNIIRIRGSKSEEAIEKLMYYVQARNNREMTYKEASAGINAIANALSKEETTMPAYRTV